MEHQWYLDCPKPAFGDLAEGYYNVGPMLAEDLFGETEEDSKMQVICNVNRADHQHYIDTFKQLDIRDVFEHAQGEDLFFACSYGGKTYHVSYLAKPAQLRVIQDVSSAPLCQFGYSEKGAQKTVIYQYGLYYDPDNNVTDTTVNCGMLYIIRLSDNSLFMIDGGHITQWNEESFAAFWRFLHQITDTPEEGTLHIAGWYFTHAHDDHLNGCTKLLRKYHDRIDLQRVMHGFPYYGHMKAGYSISTFDMKTAIRELYPQIKCLKLHTGQKFSLSDMTLEVMYAQEDAANAEDLSRMHLQDSNCSSTILKLTVDGKTVMMLGDTNVETEQLLAQNSDPSLWKSDLVQVSHHCFNYLDTLYPWIQAPMAMMPNSFDGAHQPENVPKLATVERYLKDGAIYYEGNETTGFEAGEDGFQVVYRADVIGGEWDWISYDKAHARFAKGKSFLIDDVQ